MIDAEKDSAVRATAASERSGRWLAAALLGHVAMTAAAAETAESSAPRLEEIVVTSERVQTKLIATPVSAIVVSGDTIETLGVKNVESLIAYVPGLKLDGNDPSEMRLALRGAFTSADSPSTEQSVALFIDGVYMGHTGDLTSDFFDIERVEVLRGPQGTLWGRNVVGGAISMVTKNPGPQFETTATGSLGNYSRKEFGGRIAGPFSDRWRGSLSLKTRKAEGHTTSVDILNQGLPDAGKKFGGENSKSVRAKLQFLPSDASTLTLSVDYLNDDVDAPTARNIVAGGVTTLYPLPPDRFTTWQKIAGNWSRDVYGVTLHWDWQTRWGTLSTISAFRTLDALFSEFSYDAAPIGAINLERPYSDQSISQEIRFAGKSSRLDWQSGVYYYGNKARRTEAYREYIDPRTVAAVFGLKQTPGTVQAWRLDTGDTDSFAVFGQGTWHVVPHVNLTVGGRYTWDHKATDPEAFSPVNPLSPVIDDPKLPAVNASFKTHAAKSWQKFTPKVTLDTSYEDVGGFDRIMGYVTYAKGFKSGGFETRSTQAGSEIPFEPETSKSYEIGVKTRFWKSRAEFNLTGFDVKYGNLQGIEQPRGSPTFVIFTADARTKGVESELALIPFTGLNVNVAYQWTRARYAAGATGLNGPIGGNHLPQTPDESWTVGATYTHRVGVDGELSLSANYGLKGGVFFNPDNLLEAYVDPVTRKSLYEMTRQEVLDARLAYRRGSWELALWGKNLLADDYLLRAQDPFALWGLRPAEYLSGMKLITGTWGPPRTYGIALTWRGD